ncbi:MAG: hypothetical protein NVS9B7_18570 [Flavisolibacter sp.]
MAIEIFSGNYPKQFLHQLVSGQLDVDRMDYLTRDSFFTGVVEGAIGYDRILKMLTVHNGDLMIEEKAIYTVEKFLVSRRLMYWQVYLHKTVLAAEKMLVKIIERARELINQGISLESGSFSMNYFLKENRADNFLIHLEQFMILDDTDVMVAIKNWCGHPDKVLAFLCKGLTNRKLLKVKLQPFEFEKTVIAIHQSRATAGMEFSEEEAAYLVFTGEEINTTYNPFDEDIKVLYKNGKVLDISQVDNALIQQQVYTPVKKYYLCYPG